MTGDIFLYTYRNYWEFWVPSCFRKRFLTEAEDLAGFCTIQLKNKNLASTRKYYKHPGPRLFISLLVNIITVVNQPVENLSITLDKHLESVPDAQRGWRVAWAGHHKQPHQLKQKCREAKMNSRSLLMVRLSEKKVWFPYTLPFTSVPAAVTYSTTPSQ